MLRNLMLGSFLAVLCLSEIHAARKYKMVCYYSSWASYRHGYGQFTSLHIDPDICTHAVYAFNGLDSQFQTRILDPWLSLPDGGGKDDFHKFVSLKTKNPHLKLMIGVGGWNEGSTGYSRMASTAQNRKTFIDSILDFLRRYGFDGLNLDWHYPTNRGGIPVDRTNFVSLLKELRQALKAQNYEFGISAAGNINIIDTGYDVPEVTKYVDYVSLLTYDYHGGAWELTTGHNSALYPQKGAPVASRLLNQDATVQHWIKKGADKSKLLLGLATYGRTFVLRDPNRNKVGDASFRPGNPGPFTQQDGMLGYNEIVQKFIQESGWTVKEDPDSKVPYAYNRDQWISFDNEWSFGQKALYAKQQGLGGVMVWSLEMDDFNGIGGRVNPLISTLHEVLEDGKPVPNTRTEGPVQPTRPVTRLECKVALGTYRHPDDCTKYYTCLQSGNALVPVVNVCPAGLAFDNNINACNWMDAVPECQR